jgi:hypothetical protein
VIEVIKLKVEKNQEEILKKKQEKTQERILKKNLVVEEEIEADEINLKTESF